MFKDKWVIMKKIILAIFLMLTLAMAVSAYEVDDTTIDGLNTTTDVDEVLGERQEQNVMLSYFNDDDSAKEKTVKVEFHNVTNPNGVRLEYYCLDEKHDCQITREEIFTATDFAAYIQMPLNSTYLLKIGNL